VRISGVFMIGTIEGNRDGKCFFNFQESTTPDPVDVIGYVGMWHAGGRDIYYGTHLDDSGSLDHVSKILSGTGIPVGPIGPWNVDIKNRAYHEGTSSLGGPLVTLAIKRDLLREEGAFLYMYPGYGNPSKISDSMPRKIVTIRAPGRAGVIAAARRLRIPGADSLR
jgi:hypothetical protein